MARFYLLAALAVIVSIITLASFLKFQRYAFYDKTEFQGDQKAREVPFPMIFSMVCLSILCLCLSLLFFPGIREAVLTPAVNVLANPVNYSNSVLGY